MKADLYQLRERLESAKTRLRTIATDIDDGAIRDFDVGPALTEVVTRDLNEALAKVAYLEERYA